MRLTIYDIIQGPLISEKAYELNKLQKKLVLKVHPEANKALVKEALEKLFDVKVKGVNIAIRKAKNKTVGRRAVKGSAIKKAYVTLAQGYSLDLLEQSGTNTVIQESKVK